MYVKPRHFYCVDYKQPLCTMGDDNTRFHNERFKQYVDNKILGAKILCRNWKLYDKKIHRH